MKRAIVVALCLLFIPLLMGINFPESYKMVSRATGKVIYIIEDTDILGIQYGRIASASCVFFEKNRCLTNLHLLREKPKGQIVIELQQGKSITFYKAEIDYWDGTTALDLVVLKTKKNVPIEPVKLARSCTVGEDIMYGGYGSFPFPKIRFGKLNYDPQNGFYADDIFYGDSGSGLFNMRGELMGVFYRIYTLKSSSEETFRGYAIPLETLRQFLNDGQRAKGRNFIY